MFSVLTPTKTIGEQTSQGTAPNVKKLTLAFGRLRTLRSANEASTMTEKSIELAIEVPAEDVSGDVAHELRHRCDEQMRDIPFGLQDFVDRYEGRYSDIQLPLPLRLV